MAGAGEAARVFSAYGLCDCPCLACPGTICARQRSGVKGKAAWESEYRLLVGRGPLVGIQAALRTRRSSSRVRSIVARSIGIPRCRRSLSNFRCAARSLSSSVFEGSSTSISSLSAGLRGNQANSVGTLSRRSGRFADSACSGACATLRRRLSASRRFRWVDRSGDSPRAQGSPQGRLWRSYACGAVGLVKVAPACGGAREVISVAVPALISPVF